MKLVIPKILVLLVAVAASPIAVQTARAQTIAASDLQVIAQESEDKFTARVAGLRRAGDWANLRLMGRARREANAGENIGWHAEALGAYGEGDAEAAVAAWESAPDLTTVKDASELLERARAVQRNYPGRKFGIVQFVDSDVSLERARLRDEARALLKAGDFGAIDARLVELQKSGQTDAMKQPHMQSFYGGLSLENAPVTVQNQTLEAWRAARPDSIVPRLLEIDIATSAAWDARGGGYADSITPAMSQRMDDALQRGAGTIAELPARANDSPLMFGVLSRWAQLGGNGRPFIDALYREGTARFPTYQPIFDGRVIELLPRWFGAEGELMEALGEYADNIGGAEGDGAYALGVMEIKRFEGILPHDDARFWRGIQALRAQFPDSATLRTAQMFFGEEQGKRDGNYEYLKNSLSEPNGHIVDNTRYPKPRQRAYFAEYRMNILAGGKPS